MPIIPNLPSSDHGEPADSPSSAPSLPPLGINPNPPQPAFAPAPAAAPVSAPAPAPITAAPAANDDTSGAVRAYLNGSASDPQRTVRASLYTAMDSKPDLEAELRDVSRKTGVPIDSIRAYPDAVKKQAAMQSIDFGDLTKSFPATSAYLGNVDNARIAHDDVSNLSLIETMTNSFKRGVPGLFQIGSATAMRANANTLDQIDTASNLLASGHRGLTIDQDPQGIEFMSPVQRAQYRAAVASSADGNAASIVGAQAAKAGYPSPPVVNAVMNAKTFSDAFGAFMEDPVKFIAAIGPESLVTSSPGIVGAALTPGGAAAKALMMGMGSSATDYGSSIIEALGKAGVDTNDPVALQNAVKNPALMHTVAGQAIAHAAVVGSFDAASGRVASTLALPSKLATKMAAFPITREVAGAVAQMPVQGALGAAGEAGGELAAGQPLDPGNILAEFAGEAFSTPGEIAGIAHEQVAERVQAAREAQKNAPILKQLTELSTASKVLQRDTSSFETFAQSLTEEGAPDVWINAEALLKSGVSDQVAAASPSVAAQMNEAITSGADIRIPTAEFIGRLSKDGLSQSLVDHIKTEPDGMSKAEADTYMQDHGERLNDEVQKVLSQQEGDNAFATSRAAVQTDLTNKLTAANRFTPEVNTAYSSLMANFFATQASRLGVTPEALYQQYTPSIVAESPVGASVLDQAPTSGAFKSWFGDSKVVDQGGAPLVMYHGTASDISQFDGRSTYEGGIYFTADPRYAGGRARIAEGMGHGDAPNVMPVYLSIKNPAPSSMSVARAKAEGYDGVIRDNEAVAFHPEQIKSATGNGGSFNPADPSILHQAARGTFDPATNTIALLKDADLSTFLHESGHFYLEVLADLASKPDAPAEIRADMDKLLEWFGVPGTESVSNSADDVLNQETKDVKTTMQPATTRQAKPEPVPGLMPPPDGSPNPPIAGRTPLETWNAMTLDEKRPFHEQFARGFEAYLFEGKSPSPEVHGIFQRFRSWLLNVYKSASKLNVKLTDEVRGVMDRMLATEEQIRASEAARGMGLLFKDEAEAKKFGVDWENYQAQGKKSTDTAVDELQTKGLQDMKWLSNARSSRLKQMQAQADGLRAQIERGVRGEVMSQPVYRAWDFLTKRGDRAKAGELRVDQQIGDQTGKLRTSALQEEHPEAVSLLTERHMTQEKDGIHPDIVAELFGYSSGDELIKALLAATPPAQEISARTDQRMLEQHGDLATPEGVQRATDAAIHNEVRSRMVATELSALEKAANPREETGKLIRTKLKDGTTRTRVQTIATLPRAARQFAADLIARTKVRDILPGQYSAAEARAAHAAEKALKAGDIAEAATQKRSQLINGYANTAAHDAKAEVDSQLAYLAKFSKTNKSIDPDYQDQIDSILERFDLRSGQSLKTIDKRKSLASWVTSQEDIGVAVDLPEKVRSEAFRQSYKDMTVEEFRGVVDSVRQIEHLGRLKNRLLTSKSNRDFAETRDALIASIEEHGVGRTADTRTPTTAPGRWLQAMKNFGAAHIKAATWARVMDGGKDGGPMWEAFVRAANERGDQETNMRAEATKALSEIMAPVLKDGKMTKKTFFPSVGKSFTRESVFTMALNTGNKGNLQRLLGGEGWTIEQLKPILDTLSAPDWQTVQKVWDHFETYRPMIAAKERRVSGVEPNWIEPTPVVTAHGTFKGGYYPIQYDPSASSRAEQHADAEGARAQLKGAYTAATTRRSFTKSRVEEVAGRPLLYTMTGLYGGVNDVIHDLSWHEWLIDTNRLLRSDSLDSSMREHYGPAAVRQFKTWAEAIATGDSGSRQAVDVALGRLRQSVSVAGLGFNVVSAVMQPLGLTQSIVRVGAPWIGKGVMQYIGSPIDKTREVNEKSDFMANRARTRFRELNELRNKVQGQNAMAEFVGQKAYWLMMRFQQTVDVPTWIGGYEKAISEGNDEDRSRALADQAVIDSQGGGETKDQSAIERGGPAQKLFTTFYSFMNTALNIGVANGMTNKNAAKTGVDMLMLYTVPAVVGALFKDAITPGDSGDDDDKKLAKKLAGEQLTFLMGLFVVAREFGEAGKNALGLTDHPRDYAGPAGVRMVSDTYQMAKQAQQGEFDDAFRKAAINMAGDLLGLPSAQLNRTITGAKALGDGKTHNPAALLFGYQEPH